MRLLYTLLCLLFLNFISSPLHAQTPPDSAAQAKAAQINTDSSQQVAEAYIIQQKAQQRIDSMLATQLQQEIQQANNDSKKRNELENQLKQIALRDSIRTATQIEKINSLKHSSKAYPVVLLSDTLFYIYTRIGSFNASERASAASERIRKLYEDPFFKADSLKVVQNEVTYDITYNNDNIIMSITDLDALWYNEAQSELANKYLKTIKDAVIADKASNSFVNWLKRIGFICLIILGIWIIIFGINRLFRYLTIFIRQHRQTYFKGITVKNVKLLHPNQHYLFITRVTNFLRLAIIVLALYLALPLLFSVIPQTKAIGNVLLNWIATPTKAILNGIINFLPNLFTIIVIYIATTYLVKFIKYFASQIDNGTLTINGFYRDWAWPTFNIARFLIYAFMFVIVFPYLPGSGSPAFQGVTVFLGILVSLGSSSAISNIVAGLVITYMRPFKIGDRVKIGETVGDIVEKTLLVTRIRTIKNEEITVPNSSVLSNHTINYSANAIDAGLIVHTTVTIGYDAAWKDVQQALTDAALKTNFILKKPLPFVLHTSLDDFYVSYQINAYTNEANKQAGIYSELHKNIQDAFNERGIEIMSPHYTSLRDGNATTIPGDYLGTNYKAPSFNVKNDSDKTK